jgi:hypothetical protein
LTWLPEDFLPPRKVTLTQCLLQVLDERHQAADYRAVCRSADRIRGVFGPDKGWPAANLSAAENLEDLRRHAQEFEARKAFAYAIRCTDGRDYFGCLYLKPVKSREPRATEQQRRFAAQAFVWFDVQVPQSQTEALLDELRIWVVSTWPWAAVAWPGRDPDWAQLQGLARTSTS